MGVRESCVIIARITSLVAVDGEKTKRKVSKKTNEFCSEGWTECSEPLQNVRGTSDFISSLLFTMAITCIL